MSMNGKSRAERDRKRGRSVGGSSRRGGAGGAGAGGAGAGAGAASPFDPAPRDPAHSHSHASATSAAMDKLVQQMKQEAEQVTRIVLAAPPGRAGAGLSSLMSQLLGYPTSFGYATSFADASPSTWRAFPRGVAVPPTPCVVSCRHTEERVHAVIIINGVSRTVRAHGDHVDEQHHNMATSLLRVYEACVTTPPYSMTITLYTPRVRSGMCLIEVPCRTSEGERHAIIRSAHVVIVISGRTPTPSDVNKVLGSLSSGLKRGTRLVFAYSFVFTDKEMEEQVVPLEKELIKFMVPALRDNMLGTATSHSDIARVMCGIRTLFPTDIPTLDRAHAFLTRMCEPVSPVVEGRASRPLSLRSARLSGAAVELVADDVYAGWFNEANAAYTAGKVAEAGAVSLKTPVAGEEAAVAEATAAVRSRFAEQHAVLSRVAQSSARRTEEVAERRIALPMSATHTAAAPAVPAVPAPGSDSDSDW